MKLRGVGLVSPSSRNRVGIVAGRPFARALPGLRFLFPFRSPGTHTLTLLPCVYKRLRGGNLRGLAVLPSFPQRPRTSGQRERQHVARSKP
jgi:hypothetical protein